MTIFAIVDKRNRNVSAGRSLGVSSEVCRRDDIEYTWYVYI